MRVLAGASHFFRIGVEAENSLMRRIEVRFSQIRVVDLREGITMIHGHHHHHHGHDHDCTDEDGNDPHVWLDPMRVAAMAGTIAESLSSSYPEDAAVFQANYLMLKNELMALDSEIAAMLEPVRGHTLFVYHPAFAYFCERYGLRQESIEQDGKSPTPRHIRRVLEAMTYSNVTTIFIQPQYSESPARRLAEQTGSKLEILDDLAPNYMENMRDIALKVHEGVSNQSLSSESHTVSHHHHHENCDH